MTQQLQQFNLQVSLNQLDDAMCESCGQHKFVATMKMKHIPALYSPNGKAGLIQSHDGYACVFCGAVYDLEFKYLGIYEGQQEEEGKE